MRCYMRKPEFVPENKTHKLFWDFFSDHLIPARPSDNKKKKKWTCIIEYFGVRADHRVKIKENEKKKKKKETHT